MRFKEAQSTELKTLDLAVEFKQVSDQGGFEGYASTRSVDRGGDIVEAGAFKASLEEWTNKSKLPKMLFQHDPNKIVGVWETMQEDDKGLYVKGRVLMDIPLGKEMHVLMKAGALDSMSIGYQTVEADFEGPNAQIRRITKLNLWEVSLVTFPMQPEAAITQVKRLETRGEVARILRKEGVPGQFAELVSLYGFDEAKKRVDGRREGDGDALRKSLERLSGNLKRNSEKYHA